MVELHNHAKSLGILFSPDAMSKERQLYRLSIWCTVRVESNLRTSKKYFTDVLMFPFWENQLKKEMTFTSEIKNKIRRTEMLIFVLSFNLRHHSFYTGYTTICEDFYTLNGRRRRTLPYPYTIYIYC